VRSADGQEVLGYTLAEDRRHVTYFDPAAKALVESLGRALPKLPQIELVDASDDGSKVLLHAGADNDAGRYFLFDRTAKKLGQLLPSRGELEGRNLARVKSISYAARDGVSVPAYLTLPPGKESAKGLPAVVLPHGGPAARDEWGFDWLPQFFASQGYAVIQPNFRGSAGYGEEWQNDNGFRNWRTAISDIVDAGRHLAKEGIADGERLAIVGWSYGGYAALQAAATEPAVFKAVVAIAPVTDLPMLRGQFDDYTNAQATRRWLGSGEFLEAGSPSRQANRIEAPVLLFHGDMDLNVAIAQSQKMDGALKKAGKRSELVVFQGLDHALKDSDARALMLSKAAALLAETTSTKAGG
jgi:dipeptidyl aminopeptidase/acylaminoacyl peptidase